ncbi:dTMP kinase [Ureaplasma diversum]|uniref:Thymidylate kinase n=1 Tax=Ureaplasma diversum NCTC 246 TaxID=1188241 RepID=A0A084EYE7_9BACT|nr:dTMP kinase [Ureaplasma diversum]KEZ22989.1 Thymidylate kinase [Ureaplasma diversum NCTC 246]
MNKKQTNKKPLFIVFEGIDGAGKSTVLYAVSKRLKAKTKRKIIITREPGGENCTSAESIRSLLLENIDNFAPTTCAYLYASSRNEHIQKVLKPNLVNDNVVICDRFIYSSYLYQGIAQNVGLENVRLINQAAVQSINIDYVFYFDISYKNAMARIDRRIDTNSFDNQKKEFYFNLLKNYPKILYDPVYNHNAEIIMVNANLDFESVVNFIVKKIAKIIKQQENS